MIILIGGWEVRAVAIMTAVVLLTSCSSGNEQILIFVIINGNDYSQPPFSMIHEEEYECSSSCPLFSVEVSRGGATTYCPCYSQCSVAMGVMGSTPR